MKLEYAFFAVVCLLGSRFCGKGRDGLPTERNLIMFRIRRGSSVVLT